MVCFTAVALEGLKKPLARRLASNGFALESTSAGACSRIVKLASPLSRSLASAQTVAPSTPLRFARDDRDYKTRHKMRDGLFVGGLLGCFTESGCCA
jgi:hypothetical protein